MMGKGFIARLCALASFLVLTACNANVSPNKVRIFEKPDLVKGTDWNYEEEFQAKSMFILKQTADQYWGPSFKIGDPEKYYWPKAISRLALYGQNDSLANFLIAKFKNNMPFHFVLVGSSRLLCQYKDAKAIKKNRLIFLQNGFSRTDSYNPWTAEGTENHINMSRTGGYLFAQEALKYKKEIPEAEARLVEMKNWLRLWSHTIYQTGTGEWNSSTYGFYNLVGWLNLFDFATDPEVKDMARAVLDYYATELALYYSFGTIGGPEMRSGGVGEVYNSSTAVLAYLWYGAQGDSALYKKPNASTIQGVFAAVSSYRPPEVLVKLARKELDIKTTYHNSKPSYLLEDKSYIKDEFYIHPEYTFGGAQIPYGGFSGAESQIVMWRLAINRHGNHPIEISGNGKFYDDYKPKRRPPFDQVAFNKNTAILVTKTPKNVNQLTEQAFKILDDWDAEFKKDFFERFPNEAHKAVVSPVVTRGGNVAAENKYFINLKEPDSLVINNKSAFVKVENTFIALTTVSGISPILISDTSKHDIDYILYDSAEMGKICGFSLEIGSTHEYANFTDFINTYSKKSSTQLMGNDKVSFKSVTGDELVLEYSDSGSYKAPIVDWGFGIRQPVSFITSPPFRQPQWPIGKGSGRVPTVIINGQKVNYLGEAPIFKGTNLLLDKGVLTLTDGKIKYIVDYSGRIPKFSFIK